MPSAAPAAVVAPVVVRVLQGVGVLLRVVVEDRVAVVVVVCSRGGGGGGGEAAAAGRAAGLVRDGAEGLPAGEGVVGAHGDAAMMVVTVVVPAVHVVPAVGAAAASADDGGAGGANVHLDGGRLGAAIGTAACFKKKTNEYWCTGTQWHRIEISIKFSIFQHHPWVSY